MRHHIRPFTVLTLFVLLLSGWTLAQSITGGNAFQAAAFGQWVIGASGPVSAPGINTVTLDSTEATSTTGVSFHPIQPGRTLRVSDGGNSETIKVSAVQCPSSGNACTMTADFALAHPGRFQLMSGTDGVQEAADSAAVAGGYVLIDSSWNGNDGDLQSVLLPSNVLIEDNRSGHIQIYSASSTSSPALLFSLNESGLAASSIASVHIVTPGSASDADTIQQAISGCPATGCTILLRSGTYTFTHGVQIDRPIHLVGSGDGNTVIETSPDMQSIIDAIDYGSVSEASSFWSSIGSTLQVFSTINESGTVSQSTPFPAKGNTSLSVITGSGDSNSLTRSFSPTIDVAGDSRLGFWLSAGRSGTSAVTVEVDDGVQADCWSVTPAPVYNQWRFVSLDLNNPTATGLTCTGPATGPKADLTKLAHFSLNGLQANTRYSIDEIGAWTSDFNILSVLSPGVEIEGLSLVHADLNGGSAIYTNASRTTLRHLSIQGGSGSIYGDTNADHLDIDHVVSQSAGTFGISTLGTDGVVQNSEVIGAAAGGILVGNQAAHTSVLGNNIENISGDGIDLEAPQAGAVSNNQISNIETFGILVYGSARALVRGNTIQNANEAGIQVQNDSSGTLIAGNTIFDTGKNGIDTNSGGVLIRGNLVDTTGASSGFPTAESSCVNVLPQAGSGPVQVAGNTCRNLGPAGGLNSFGVWIQAPTPATSVDGNTVVSPGAGGIQISTVPQGSGLTPSPISSIDVRNNTIDLGSVSGAFGISLSDCLQCSLTGNRVLEPAPNAPPLLAVLNNSQGTQITGNLLDRAGIAGIVGLSLDSSTKNAFIGDGNTITTGDGTAPAIQDTGNGTKYGLNNTGNTVESLSPFATDGTPAFNSPTGSAPFTVTSTTPVPYLSLAGGAGTSVSTAQLQVGNDTPVTSNARIAWSAVASGALTQGRQIGQWTPDRAVVALRLEAVLGTAPVGCTSQPALTLQQGAATLTLPLAGTTNDSGAQTLVLSAGNPIQLSYTAGANCAQVPADLDATVSFRMK